MKKVFAFIVFLSIFTAMASACSHSLCPEGGEASLLCLSGGGNGGRPSSTTPAGCSSPSQRVFDCNLDQGLFANPGPGVTPVPGMCGVNVCGTDAQDAVNKAAAIAGISPSNITLACRPLLSGAPEWEQCANSGCDPCDDGAGDRLQSLGEPCTTFPPVRQCCNGLFCSGATASTPGTCVGAPTCEPPDAGAPAEEAPCSLLGSQCLTRDCCATQAVPKSSPLVSSRLLCDDDPLSGNVCKFALGSTCIPSTTPSTPSQCAYDSVCVASPGSINGQCCIDNFEDCSLSTALPRNGCCPGTTCQKSNSGFYVCRSASPPADAGACSMFGMGCDPLTPCCAGLMCDWDSQTGIKVCKKPLGASCSSASECLTQYTCASVDQPGVLKCCGLGGAFCDDTIPYGGCCGAHDHTCGPDKAGANVCGP